MAATERTVTRREPIIVTVDVGAAKPLSFECVPLPWRKRNDLGNLLMQSYTDTLNKLVASSQPVEDGPVELHTNLFESGLDYAGMFALAFPALAKDPGPTIDQLDYDQMIEVLSAVLEVNGFDRLIFMLDPDRKKDPTIGELAPLIEETTDDGAKTE